MLSTIINGFSCGTCHHQGLIYKEDEIRGFSADPDLFDADQMTVIRELYREPQTTKKQLETDNAIYKQALTEAGLDPNGIDPIKQGFIYYNRDLNFNDVAMELDVSKAELQQLLGTAPFNSAWAALESQQRISRFELNQLLGEALTAVKPNAQYNSYTQGDLLITPACMTASPASLDPCIQFTPPPPPPPEEIIDQEAEVEN